MGGAPALMSSQQKEEEVKASKMTLVLTRAEDVRGGWVVQDDDYGDKYLLAEGFDGWSMINLSSGEYEFIFEKTTTIFELLNKLEEEFCNE